MWKKLRNINQIKVGSILSYAQMAVSSIIGLLYTPLTVHCLGKSEYGLYQTVASTISMISVVNLGFNAGYIRYYAQYKKSGEQNKIEKLNGLFVIIFTAIGIVALLCGIYLTIHLELVFDTGLTQQEYATARILLLISTVNLAISFPMSVFQNIVLAHESFIFLKSVGILSSLCGPLVCLPLLLAGYRSIAMVIVNLIVMLVTNAFYVYYVIFRLKNRFVFHEFEKGIVKGLFVYTAFIAVNSVIDQINMNVDKVLLSRYCGPAEAGVYSVGFTLYAYYQAFSTAVSGVFTPRIHEIVRENSGQVEMLKKELTRLFVKVGRIQFLIEGYVLYGFTFLGMPFITKFWIGSGYEDSYTIALLLMSSASIALIQNIGIEIQRAENMHWFRTAAYFPMALVNLILSIYLCQKYGAVGSAIGTAVSLILANGIVMNIFYHKKCHIDIIQFWKEILSMTKGSIPAVIVALLFARLNCIYTIGGFLIAGVCYTLLYWVGMYVAGMNAFEKEQMRSIVFVHHRQ